MKLAEQQHISDLAANRIDRLQKELSDMEQTAEASDMMEQFEQIQQQLAGAFANLREVLEKELEDLKLHQRQYDDRLQDERGKSETLHSTIEQNEIE